MRRRATSSRRCAVGAAFPRVMLPAALASFPQSMCCNASSLSIPRTCLITTMLAPSHVVWQPVSARPAPLLAAAQALGVPPSACAYVGDDARDIVAGKAAGMATVAACYGYLGQGADPVAWGADARIDTPLDLFSVLALETVPSGLN